MHIFTFFVASTFSCKYCTFSQLTLLPPYPSLFLLLPPPYMAECMAECWVEGRTPLRRDLSLSSNPDCRLLLLCRSSCPSACLLPHGEATASSLFHGFLSLVLDADILRDYIPFHTLTVSPSSLFSTHPLKRDKVAKGWIFSS